MASLNLFFTPVAMTQRRVSTAATAAKSTGGSSEEKGLFDWILGNLAKEDQFYETDPILKKVEGKNESGTTGRKSTVAVPPKKNGNGGGFGGLFAKK